MNVFRQFFRSITREGQVEKALRESEERYALAIASTKDGIWEANFQTGEYHRSARWLEILGYEEGDLEPTLKAFMALLHPDDVDAAMQAFHAHLKTGTPYDVEYRVKRKMGEYIWISATGQAVWDRNGKALRMAGSINEITQRKRAEDALRESRERFRNFAEISADWLWETDEELRYTYLSDRFQEVTGVTPEKRYGARREDFVPKIEFKTYPEKWAAHTADLAARRPFQNFEFQSNAEDDAVRFVRVSGMPVFDDDGKFRGYRGTGTNITEQKKAQEAFESQRQVLETLVAHIPAIVTMRDANGRFQFLNKHAETLFTQKLGAMSDDIIGRTPAQIVGSAKTENLDRITQQVFETGEPVLGVERPSLIDGKTPYSSYFVPIKGAAGSVESILTISLDISERSRAEEQLRQAQKMEAVGQLTGGVAHDFNNLLTVVLGNLQLLSDRVANDETARSYVANAIAGARRGAELTYRLLAFSRKQSLVPVSLDPRDLVDGLLELMRRTLGETIDIEVSRSEDLWRCVADAAQFESAILNLAINARDAMPDGGKLTIEANNTTIDEGDTARSDMEPGDYVVVSVTDTGIGIPDSAINHVFEPFFTTKEVGKGSGLGLSMVYGFAKQSGGNVTIHSEGGVGTTVRIYLPRSTARPEESFPAEADSEPRARGETILVVEDDPDVRSLSVALLKNLGYEIVEAEDGASALAALEDSPSISMLFTDVVLPGGMSGPTLAAEITCRRPGMSVLFTSGYTDDALIHPDQRNEGIELLKKPFRKCELAQKVRATLDRANA